MRLKDEFFFEAVPFEKDELNFSFSNENDFWRFKEKETLPTQKIILPLAIKRYDKKRNLVKIDYSNFEIEDPSKSSLDDSSKNNKHLKKPILVDYENMESEEIPTNRRGFSFSPKTQSEKMKNKKPINNNIDMSLNPYSNYIYEEKNQKESFLMNTNEIHSKKNEDVSPQNQEDILTLKEKIKHYSEVLNINSDEIEPKNDSPIRKALYVNTVLNIYFF